MIFLYHGTDEDSAKRIFNEGILLNVCKPNVDFGRGFYTTPDIETAMKWAKRKAFSKCKAPSVVKLSFDYEGAIPLIKMFNDDLEWAQFVINNRNGMSYVKKVSVGLHNLDSRFDITEGSIADCNLAELAIALKKEGKPISDAELLIDARRPAQKQIVLHNEIALRFVKRITYQNLL